MTLDVGGYRYSTRVSTLTEGLGKQSAFKEILKGKREEDGSYFLDRDGVLFVHILRLSRALRGRKSR